MLIDAPAELLESPVLRAILTAAPCDVAALVGGEPAPGPLLVPFVGAEHDWSAIELGAWLAGAWQVPLRLAGPTVDGRDSSRLLASASLAVQHALGIAAEPLLLAPGPDELVRAAQDASLVIVGLSDRWQKEGLGQTRARARPARPRPRAARPSRAAPRRSGAAREPDPLHLVAQAAITLTAPTTAGWRADTAGTSRSGAAR